jgi:hypothetical protein
MSTAPKYIFGRIPNNILGLAMIESMKLFLNKDRYTLRVRGQGLIKGEDWRRYAYGIPLDKSTHLRVYIVDKNK